MSECDGEKGKFYSFRFILVHNIEFGVLMEARIHMKIDCNGEKEQKNKTKNQHTGIGSVEAIM